MNTNKRRTHWGLLFLLSGLTLIFASAAVKPIVNQGVSADPRFTYGGFAVLLMIVQAFGLSRTCYLVMLDSKLEAWLMMAIIPVCGVILPLLSAFGLTPIYPTIVLGFIIGMVGAGLLIYMLKQDETDLSTMYPIRDEPKDWDG